jgi:hypothetical protein
MSWEYRVFKHPDGSHAIHELYHLGDNYTGHTANPARLSVEDDSDDSTPVESLRWTLERMMEALEKPVLDYEAPKP